MTSPSVNIEKIEQDYLDQMLDAMVEEMFAARQQKQAVEEILEHAQEVLG